MIIKLLDFLKIASETHQKNNIKKTRLLFFSLFFFSSSLYWTKELNSKERRRGPKNVFQFISLSLSLADFQCNTAIFWSLCPLFFVWRTGFVQHLYYFKLQLPFNHAQVIWLALYKRFGSYFMMILLIIWFN